MEQPLAYYNNCLLGAIVLPKYVNNKFKHNAEFDYDLFIEDVKYAVRIMNIFSDINQIKHPLDKQKEADIFGKRIGIEVTGLADMLAMLNINYNETDTFLDKLFEGKAIAEIKESIEIAKEIGCCPALRDIGARERLVHSSYIKNLMLTEDVEDDIIKYGMRNTALNTIGPCGSISIISDNCTSGIEPLFQFSYTRKNRIDGKTYEFIHYPACKYMLENFKDFENKTLQTAKKMLHYVEANELNYVERINVQSNIQSHIDSGISSTINLSKDTNIDTIYNIYKLAWESELKGITVFVDGCKDVSVLKSVDNKTEVVPELFEKELLDIETAERHRVMWKGSKLYVNVSLDDNNPIEIFAKLPLTAGVNGDGVYNPILWQERNSNWDLICRLISMLFRYNIQLDDIIEQLDKSSYSMVDAAGILGRILKRYQDKPEYDEDDPENIGNKCESCGEMTYFYEGGCGKCLSCGFSACG